MSASSACFGTTHQSPCSSSTRHAARSHRHLPRLTSSVCRHFLCPPQFAGKNFVVVHFDSGRSHGRSLRGDCFDLFDLLPHGQSEVFWLVSTILGKDGHGASIVVAVSKVDGHMYRGAARDLQRMRAPRPHLCGEVAPCNVRAVRNTYFNIYYS